MTAQVNVLGKRPDGTVRRYALETPKGKGSVGLVHVIATKTGQLTYCGQTIRPILSVPHAQARSLERLDDTRTRGFRWCQECRTKMLPQPDPAIWGPPRPAQ